MTTTDTPCGFCTTHNAPHPQCYSSMEGSAMTPVFPLRIRSIAGHRRCYTIVFTDGATLFVMS